MKTKYMQPETLVSDILPNAVILTGSATIPDPGDFGMGGGAAPGEAI